MEAAIEREEEMVKMLVAPRRLASPALRLTVENFKGKMPREWDTAMSQEAECQSADAAVQALDKRLRRREQEDK